MTRRTWTAGAIGAIAGGFFGLLALALVADRVLDGGMESIAAGEALRPAFAVGQAALYLYVVAAGAVAGSALGMLGYGVASQADPAEDRYGMGRLALLGALLGTVAAFAASRAAIGVGGVIEANVIHLSVFRAVVVAAVTGAATGLLVGVAVERLAAPSAIGFAGAAAPPSPGAFVRHAASAVGLPSLALLLAAAVIVVLSRVLLHTGETGALVIFGGAAALFLIGAAVIAARPPQRGNDD